MDDDQLVSHVEELGLSNKESKVYLACLKTGPSSVQRIAEESGIKRVTTYVILESLRGLGLVSHAIKGKKTLFSAEDPINLERLIIRRERELVDQRHNFDEILPKLKGLSTQPKDSPTVKFFDSDDGIRTIMNAFIDQAKKPGVKQVYGFSNLDLVLSYFPDFRNSMSNPERSRAGVHSQFLYTCKEGPVMRETDSIRDRESRWLPTEKFPIVGDFTIVGDSILMLSLGAEHAFGITVKSKELASGLKTMFEAAWEAAEQYN